MNERIPPQDLDAEMALLGSMMMSKDACADTLLVIGPGCSDYFYVPAHKHLFKVLVDVYSDPASAMDMIVVQNILHQRDLFDAVGGQNYLVQLAESFADWANAAHYAKIVREMYIKREFIRQCTKAIDQGFNILSESPNMLAGMGKVIDQLNRASIIDRVPLLESELIRSVKHPDDYEKEGIPIRVPVALGNLGYILNGGFAYGTFTVIGALPSCGKTSLAICLAHHASQATNGCNVLFVSAEMLSREVAIRFIAIRTGLGVGDMESGNAYYDQFINEREKAALESDRGKQIYILDDIDDVGTIVAHIKNMVRKHGIRMVIVDYLGMLELHGKYEREDIAIGAITKAFKKLARHEGIAIIMPSQFSRGVAKEKRPPVMSDLRGSGCIEQDADNILLIHATGKDDHGNIVGATIYIAKQRQGNTGKAEVWYTKSTMIFSAEPVEAAVDAAQEQIPF